MSSYPTYNYYYVDINGMFRVLDPLFKKNQLS